MLDLRAIGSSTSRARPVSHSSERWFTSRAMRTPRSAARSTNSVTTSAVFVVRAAVMPVTNTSSVSSMSSQFRSALVTERKGVCSRS